MRHETARRATQRYLSHEAAVRYDGVHRDRARHWREVRCIQRALRQLPAGAHVLDLPCGTGRMFEALASRGLRITGADRSPSMVSLSRERAQNHPAVVDVCESDVFATGFDAASFDAVLCNRLLHHFAAAEDRQAALRELARLSRGLVVVSFFCNASFDALRTRWKRARHGTTSGRSSISYATFRRDLEAAGLRVERILPTLPGISKQWYVVAHR